jgi:prepilin-type N-terminal cleavage/methylation domain-containing protein
MKTRPATLRPQFAFTLIELITVIAIIAILMGLLFPAMSGARDSARKAKAGTVVRSIVNACKNYQTDYGKFPPIKEALTQGSSGGGGGANRVETNDYYSYGDTEIAKCKVNNNQLFDVLRAIAREPNKDHKLNRRQQKYFEEGKATDVKNPREGFADGKEYPDEIQGQLMDPWGKQYCVVLDADGDEVLKLDQFFQDQTEVIRVSAASFSMGKNGDIGGKGYQGRLRKERSNEAPEDVVSWQ